ncbi:MAG: SHOCT domain-containing protein [Acetatifactor sp.]|nr:SHOCT domain-containing protein [Acetatifactor sp.]
MITAFSKSTNSRPVQNLVVKTKTTINQQPSSNSDSYEELKKIKELLDKGVISQEDFDTKKKQLLDI